MINMKNLVLQIKTEKDKDNDIRCICIYLMYKKDNTIRNWRWHYDTHKYYEYYNDLKLEIIQTVNFPNELSLDLKYYPSYVNMDNCIKMNKTFKTISDKLNEYIANFGPLSVLDYPIRLFYILNADFFCWTTKENSLWLNENEYFFTNDMIYSKTYLSNLIEINKKELQEYNQKAINY